MPGADELKCSRCGKDMIIAHRTDNQVLYKCRNSECGHMTLVQEMDRDIIRKERKGS